MEESRITRYNADKWMLLKEGVGNGQTGRRAEWKMRRVGANISLPFPSPSLLAFWSPGLLLVFCSVCLGFYWKSSVRNVPLFCSMPEECERVSAEEPVAVFKNPDTLLEHQLYLLSDSAQQPLMFYSDIMTPVCIDGICKPVHIELYWNLVGSYAGYGVFPQEPLTKFDHDEFVQVDYQKLDGLLADNNSILSRQTLSDLFDETLAPAKAIEYQGVKLDAVSGATRKEIKESVVGGALYSCYTLWHLVYGQVQQEIEGHLQTIYSAELARYFLNSAYPDYHFYALKQMDVAEMELNISRIAQIFKDAKPLIRTYILKKLPRQIFEKENVAQALYQVFSTVDISSKTLLINYLPDAHTVAAELLSGNVETMSRNQLKVYLDFLATDKSKITAAMQENLRRASASQTYTYAYMIQEFFSH